jgi:hypothetical protein
VRLLLAVLLIGTLAMQEPAHRVEPPPGYHCSMAPIAGETFHECHCQAMADPMTACESPMETKTCDTYCWMTHHCRCPMSMDLCEKK